MKILVIRFSSIGDIVLTSPIIRCVKQQVEGAVVHVLTKKRNSGLFLNNPNVDKVFEYNSSMSDIIRSLRREHYDFIVDLHKNWRSLCVRAALGVRSASFPKLDFKKLVYTKLKVNLLPDKHIVDRYFEAVRWLGVKNDGLGLDYFISDANELSFGDLPEEFKDGFMAVVVGGQHNTKNLPTSKVVEVCKLVDKPVVLLGGPEDAERAQDICKKVGGNIDNMCGKLSLEQSASLIKLSDVVLANDTGLMHIAAALRKPIVSVWGNTVPAFGMYPYMPGCYDKSIIVENKSLKCRPCHKLGYRKCPKGHFACMNNLSSEKIASAITSLL